MLRVTINVTRELKVIWVLIDLRCNVSAGEWGREWGEGECVGGRMTVLWLHYVGWVLDYGWRSRWRRHYDFIFGGGVILV